MEQYIKDIKNLAFRKEKLLEQAKKIESLLSGKYIHYYEFIQDENGNYSEEKVWQMIEELMEALRKYDVYFLLEEEIWSKEDMEDFSFAEKEEQFFKSFLYCVLRWGSSGIGVIDGYAGKGNFEDFLEMAASIRTNTNFKEEDLLYQEQYEVTDNPFYTFNQLYVKVMKTSPYTMAKEESILAMRRKYATQIEEMEEYWEESTEEYFQGEEMSFLDEEYDLSHLLQELYEEEKKEIESFINKEIFAEQYLLFRSLYFQMDGYLLNRMQYIIEGMLDIYLYQKNLSKFLDDELFFKTFAMLRKTTSHLQKYLPEEVK